MNINYFQICRNQWFPILFGSLPPGVIYPELGKRFSKLVIEGSRDRFGMRKRKGSDNNNNNNSNNNDRRIEPAPDGRRRSGGRAASGCGSSGRPGTNGPTRTCRAIGRSVGRARLARCPATGSDLPKIKKNRTCYAVSSFFSFEKMENNAFTRY